MEFLQRLFFLFAFVLLGWTLNAQDFHKTLYNMMPLAINPAYAGDFEGTFRAGGMFKAEHNTVYKTPSFFVDVPIIMIRKRDWISAGLSFDADNAGDLGFSTTRSMIAASYHLALDKKGKSYLVAGYQFGSDSQKLKSAEKGRFEDAADPDAMGSADEKASNSINNAGLMYRSILNKKTDFNIGVAFNYVIRQEGSVKSASTGGVIKRPSKIIVHGLLNRQINEKLSIHPSFIVQSRGKEGSEIMVQAMAGYLFNKEKNLNLRGGLGYDIDEGPAVLLGANYGDWKFRVSFDIPLYGVADATSFGGFEIAASKIFKMYKKPVVKPTICCPDL